MPAMHLHLDLGGGVAGDMLLAALIDAAPDPAALLADLERDLLALGFGAVALHCQMLTRSSLRCRHLRVAVPQEAGWQPRAQPLPKSAAPAAATALTDIRPLAAAHSHRPYRAIRALLATAALAPRVRERAQAVFAVLATAEGAVHGIAPDEVEFHEVGARDAIVDVVGCALALEALGVASLSHSALLLGDGRVRCAHGDMPVPVPAVAEMLRREPRPWRPSPPDCGECTTPTGCALVLGLGAVAGAAPAGRIAGIGHGAGTRIMPGVAGFVRALLLEPAAAADDGLERDTVLELRCVIDDQTGEDLAALVEACRAAGARDAWLVPLVMKKGRPGHELVVLAAPAQADALAALVLEHSSAIGLRRSVHERLLLPRNQETVQVDGLELCRKAVTTPAGRTRRKAESDDVQRLAAHAGISRAEARRRIEDAPGA